MHWQLAAYLALNRLLSPAAPAILRRRLAKGREDPARWREKLGYPGLERPPGRLIWMHAVGLGEVMALRGLIAALPADLAVLVTSSALSSAQVAAGQLAPNARHQFLPLDTPGPVARFLSHWRPSLAVWAEQDLWPRAVVAADRAGVPLAMVNARMGAAAHARRDRAAGLYGELLRRFALIAAQDEGTAANLRALGADGVRVTGPMKAAAPPLGCDEGELARLRELLAGRRVWLAGPTHPGDEAVALAAQARLGPPATLILAPRYPERGVAVAAAAAASGLTVAFRSRGEAPPAAGGVWLADTFGEMGLWYRLADAALVGGGFDAGGHNPWEAAALGAAILHGPETFNFMTDYKSLHGDLAARPVSGPEDLLAALSDPALPAMATRAQAIAARLAAGTQALAADLIALARP
ncbi:MAG TPA: glycosyltransferase N-terminal domain-containing protein [Paracoccaceae bacterium]|nr:glycosyltransferase N-terminal domain-containing protein [Paracoccaceae bacterium]